MDDDHDQDPDPPSPAAAGGRCPCCSSSGSPAVPWRRSVKRNLGPEKGEGDDGEGESAAEECAALRKAMAAAQSIAPALQAEVEEEHLAKVRMELR